MAQNGFSEQEIKEIQSAFKVVEDGIVSKIDEKIQDINKWRVQKDEADKLNQKALDEALAAKNRHQFGTEKKTFISAFADAIKEKESEVMNFGKNSNQRLTLDLKGLSFKTVGDMTTATNLSGDPVFSYGIRQGFIPANKINLRDLIPTAYSSTGQYVTYREGAGEGEPSFQTEGSGKSQVDSDFTNVKTVTKYLSAYQRFTKQLMHNLPWVQTSLSRVLLRKFYAKENSLFYTTLSTNSDPLQTTTGGNIAEKIIDAIGEQGDKDFGVDFVLIPWASWSALMKTGYPSTGTSYSIPGGVVFDNNGVARIAGVPIIPASWVTADDIQLVDRDYIERVEVESVRVEFSFDDHDNFTENKVTARIECMEELNLLRTDAHLNYGTAS